MPTNVHKLIYRKRAGTTPVTSFRLSEATRTGLQDIQTAFCERYPADRYPTLSLVLDVVLSRAAKELDQNPEWLAAEVAEFRRRYQKAK